MSAQEVMTKKARQAQVIFEDLVKRFGIEAIPTTFIADPRREGQINRSCFQANPFPGVLAFALLAKSRPGVKKLFKDEKILQTPAIAAVLSACSSVATEIGRLRGDDVSGAETFCDLSFAGLQAIRLYMADHKGKEFTKARVKSATMVNNALNGSFYKYRAKDGRDVSFHVYYQNQQQRLVKALGLSKPSEKYAMLSIKKDRKEIAEITARSTALELEELAFNCDTCGCMIRSREEWESSEVGKAVKAMPLIRQDKEAEGPAPVWGKPNSRGPLSGIKVLDLTHIIAGPACSRILAEYGADVLRLFIMFIGDYEKPAPWSAEGIKGCNRFRQRFWGLMDIVNDNADTTDLNLDALIKAVGDDYESCKFNTAIAKIMTALNTLYARGGVTKKELNTLCILLYPVAPHITSEMYERLNGGAKINEAAFPVYNPENLIEDEIEIPVQVMGKLRGRIVIEKGAEQSEVMEKVKESGILNDEEIVKVVYVPDKIVNIVIRK